MPRVPLMSKLASWGSSRAWLRCSWTDKPCHHQMGQHGRDASGRFVKGCKGGPGNPHAQHVGQLRSALLEAVTAEDMEAIARKLVESAKAGNVQAVKELLDRLVGKPAQAIHMVSEAATTVRVVLHDRTESPTHKMVQAMMAEEALGADERKKLEADEQDG